MRTAEERIAALHMRMAALREKQERRKTLALGAGCAGLCGGLSLLVFGGSAACGGTAGAYTGATMLFEDAGPYVLLALIAFMAGVIITALCIRFRRKNEADAPQEKARDESRIQRNEP